MRVIASLIGVLLVISAYPQLVDAAPRSCRPSGRWACPVPPPTVTATSTPSATPTATAPPSAYFGTLSPDSVLPSGADCINRVRRDPREHRPENYTANHYVPPYAPVEIDGAQWANYLEVRIDGNFTGTTDEIIQWAACKWGIDEDITRARAVTESSWRQSTQGDYTTSSTACSLIGKSAPCYQSYGLLQIKGTVHELTYPRSQQSTPWNADYALAWQRACFEGEMGWLGNGYAAGDMWGCVGAYYSGNWYDSGAQNYIQTVRGHLANRTWEGY